MGALASASLAMRPKPPASAGQPLALGRIAASYINLYSEPSFESPKIHRYLRDELITLLAAERSDDGPLHNPLWYRTDSGYVHSGNLQIVGWNLQSCVPSISEGGDLFEISVPFTRAYSKPGDSSRPLYRLYYKSNAWVEGIEEDALGQPWYKLKDTLLDLHYYARAEHLRFVPQEEYSPLSPDVPGSQKHIEISLRAQEVRAYEFNRLVFCTRISSGIPSYIPDERGKITATPTGKLRIYKKVALRHMGDGRLTSDIEAYELPGVPWVTYFHDSGVAFHGTFWHSDFGRPRSHGCINMQTDEAKWLFRWATPVLPDGARFVSGYGNRVYVS